MLETLRRFVYRKQKEITSTPIAPFFERLPKQQPKQEIVDFLKAEPIAQAIVDDLTLGYPRRYDPYVNSYFWYSESLVRKFETKQSHIDTIFNNLVSLDVIKWREGEDRFTKPDHFDLAIGAEQYTSLTKEEINKMSAERWGEPSWHYT